MKILESKDSLNSYIQQLQRAINSETEAIEIYDMMIANSTISAGSKKILSEIRDDERDHLVLLTELFYDEIEEQFPNYGDEDTETVENQ